MTTTEERPAWMPDKPRSEWTTKDLLLIADELRPRSQQRQLGMSDLGGCERRVGYTLAGVEPTDNGSSLQAVMGTAIHESVDGTLKRLQELGFIPAEDLVEHEVTFAGVLGHLDRYESATRRLIDVKTTSSRWLEHVKVHGPDEDHEWQTNFYAAALIILGYQVDEIVIDYIARDTGEEHRVTLTPDPAVVRKALDWLNNIRATDLEWLPRKYAPTSAFCGNCRFFTTCWGAPRTEAGERDLRVALYIDDPDGARWAQQLFEARAAKNAAVKLEEEAKGALGHLRPNEEGVASVDVGFRLPLTFRVKQVTRLDVAQVRADYAAAGAAVPEKTKPEVSIGFGPAIEKAQDSE